VVGVGAVQVVAPLAGGVRHRPSSMDAVATSGLESAKLLHVHRDQFPSSLAFVATDESARGTVHPAQSYPSRPHRRRSAYQGERRWPPGAPGRREPRLRSGAARGFPPLPELGVDGDCGGAGRSGPPGPPLPLRSI
jgi:hypothetical protein